MVEERESIYHLKNLIKNDFENEIVDYSIRVFRLSYEQYPLCSAVEMISQRQKHHSKQRPLSNNF